jgi:hypothetical protein
VTAKQQDGSAKEGVQVLDVSQILARSLVGKKVPAAVGGGHVTTTEMPPVKTSITPDVVQEQRPTPSRSGTPSYEAEPKVQAPATDAPSEASATDAPIEAPPDAEQSDE